MGKKDKQQANMAHNRSKKTSSGETKVRALRKHVIANIVKAEKNNAKIAAGDILVPYVRIDTQAVAALEKLTSSAPKELMVSEIVGRAKILAEKFTKREKGYISSVMDRLEAHLSENKA